MFKFFPIYQNMSTDICFGLTIIKFPKTACISAFSYLFAVLHTWFSFPHIRNFYCVSFSITRSLFNRRSILTTLGPTLFGCLLYYFSKHAFAVVRVLRAGFTFWYNVCFLFHLTLDFCFMYSVKWSNRWIFSCSCLNLYPRCEFFCSINIQSVIVARTDVTRWSLIEILRFVVFSSKLLDI